MKHLLKQAARFVGLSGIGWLLDFAVFTVLGTFSGNATLNNFISSWVGVTFVFVFATRKVFRAGKSRIPLKVKYLIYLGYQLVLISLVSGLLGAVNGLIRDHAQAELILRYSALLSKIAVTPVTVALNFVVMKNVIEKL